MGPFLFPLPVLAILLAALDSLLVRAAEPWRAPDVRLFFQAYYLWAIFGCLALLPARLTWALIERRRARRASARGLGPWLVLLAWMVLPVIAHATLDRHTSLVGFAGLADSRPWMELLGMLAGGVGVVIVLGRWIAGLAGVRTAVVGTLIAVACSLFLPVHEKAPVASEGARRPNLLLLVWDTCRSDRLEPYGYGRDTSPGLARLAEQALVFEDSLSVSSFTFTSHLSMLTGVHPTTHGAHLLDMRFDPSRAQSIAEILAANGYRTGAFVGTDVLAGRTGLRTGFDVYDDAVDPAVCDTHAWRVVHDLQTLLASVVPFLRFDGRPHWIQDFQRPASEVLQRARSWIDRDDPRPWFCFVNLYDAHWPYLPEGEGAERLVAPYDGEVDGFLFRSDRWQPDHVMSAADKRHVADLYEAEIYDLDREVEHFLDGLHLEHGGTGVLVTADHGEGLGEADTWNHDGVREPQVRVPLVLRLPAADPVGRRVRAPVSGVDVAPTLLALAGVAAPAGMEGVDVSSPELAKERLRWIDDRDHLRADEHRTALYRGTFKLVRMGSGADARHELYDLEHDPIGVHDVHAEHPELYEELVRCMEARQGAIAPIGAGDSAGSAAALQALGYAGE